MKYITAAILTGASWLAFLVLSVLKLFDQVTLSWAAIFHFFTIPFLPVGIIIIIITFKKTRS